MCPQFTSLEGTAIRCGGRSKKKKKNHLPTSSLNRTSPSTQVRRSTVCKYPALLFDTSTSFPLRCHRGLSKKSSVEHVGDSPEIRPPQSHSDGTISPVSRNDASKPSSLNTRWDNASTSGAKVTPRHTGFAAGKPTTPSSLTTRTSMPAASSVLTPPHIETPEMARYEQPASSSVLSLFFSQNHPRTPPRTENVLVRDTPESDYGLKVTWRRRKKLMRLLTERGQLLDTEAMISNQRPWSAISGQMCEWKKKKFFFNPFCLVWHMMDHIHECILKKRESLFHGCWSGWNILNVFFNHQIHSCCLNRFSPNLQFQILTVFHLLQPKKHVASRPDEGLCPERPVSLGTLCAMLHFYYIIYEVHCSYFLNVSSGRLDSDMKDSNISLFSCSRNETVPTRERSH